MKSYFYSFNIYTNFYRQTILTFVLQEVFFYLQENIFYLNILLYKNFTKIWLSVIKLILKVE